MDNYFTLIILILLLGVLAFILFRKRGLANPSPVEGGLIEEESIVVAEEDQRVLDQLREAGSDLSKPHAMEFYLHFPTEEAANMVALRVKAEGFHAEVKEELPGKAWLCYVTKQMVPEGTRITAIGHRFTSLANEFQGEYTGWETSLEYNNHEIRKLENGS
ncbi:MAG: ribonuclease E inhibitor RraB [Acidobacteria bacterium]|nr:ribonuclease E inhibitor RraB [Acidobacteriota bacterium]